MEYPAGYFNRPSKELTIALILASANVLLDIDEVEFGAPSIIDPIPLNDDDENTYIPAKFLNDSNSQYAGKNGFLYRRARFPEALITDFGNFTGYPTTIHNLLTAINLKFNTQVTPADVMDGVLLTPTESIELTANPKSPNYVGKGTLWLVERVLTQPDLDGFHEWVA